MARAKQSKDDIANEKAFTSRVGAASISIVEFTKKIRAASHESLADIYDTIPEDTPDDELLSQANKSNKLDRRLAELATIVIAIMVTRDDWLKKVTEDEYNVSWYEHNFSADNKVGAHVRLRNPSRRLREERFNWQNNKLANSQILRTARQTSATRLRDSIVNSLNQGKSLRQATRDIDVVLGFRDAQGELTDFARRAIRRGDLVIRGGEIYNSVRVARTEMARMHAWANVDAMTKAQELGVDERLIKIATIDGREREQSREMAGQISDIEGKFLYPDGNRYYMGQQPKQWAINDRGTTAPFIQGVDADAKITPPPNQPVPWDSFLDFSKNFDLKINELGKIASV